MKSLELDGSKGGGQLLRTALTLSLITGTPFRMHNIRGARKPKPGLMRQHLACVKAASAIGHADLEGATLGSTDLVFAPHALQAGSYRFEIGTGGSTSLLLQTVLPALLHANEASHVEITGGTHNPMAPPANFLKDSYLPLLISMGASVDFNLKKVGFMQIGGGAISCQIQPLKPWNPLHLLEASPPIHFEAGLLHAHLKDSVLHRFREVAKQALIPWVEDVQLLEAVDSDGPGACLSVSITETSGRVHSFSSMAQFGSSSESVARQLVKQVKDHLSSSATVNRWLADQLLLPMSLAGEGSFITQHETGHLSTSMELIPKFLPVAWSTKRLESGGLLVQVAQA